MSTVAHKEKLAQHHKLANQYYQQGNYPAALYELGLALAYATHPEDKNIIQSNIGTIRAMMKQDPNSFEETDNNPAAQIAAPASPRLTLQNLKHNRLALTAVTIAVLCLTPIAIKFVQIVTGGNAPQATQTTAESAAPVGEAATSATTEEAAGNIIVVESPVAPATTSTTEAPVILSEQTAPTAAAPVNAAPAAASTTKQIAGTKVNLREQASTTANTLIRLQKDTTVTVVDPTPVSADGYTWVKVQTPEGVVGFVASSFLRDSAAVAPVATTTTATTDAATAPASTVPTDATSVNAAAATGTAKIIGTGVSFRTQPSTQGPLITTLSADNAFTILESKSVTADGYSWTKIRTAQGTVGWVASQFISP